MCRGVLTNKQKWRRLPNDSVRKLVLEESETIEQSQGLATARSNSYDAGKRNPFEHNRLWSSTGSLSTKAKSVSVEEDVKEIPKKKKKVSFKSAVHVVLVPTSEEYIRAGLRPILWWSFEDISSFKKCALQQFLLAKKKFEVNNILSNKSQLMPQCWEVEDDNRDKGTMESKSGDTPREMKVYYGTDTKMIPIINKVGIDCKEINTQGISSMVN